MKIPTQCSECGKIAALYEVYIPDKRRLVVDLKIPRWICLECWQTAISDSEKSKV